ncbi:hypothetical protein MtrunA17_Chr2g0331551 [Medicago truncatula]|uniref:Uncharacterized protein n=1 Tax=Medicago truncatula TaxID=3880 RepID=A0A072VDP2_MEDTR|nr:hypothetical protein MTR_2g101675 [Medicago truncatula]RHN76387.1 hypothetical protein MtrunA17_Chr2g0331551 [Medicago truncatula]
MFISRSCSILQHQSLRVTTPGSIELNHKELVLFNYTGKVLLLQNDNVFFLHFLLLELVFYVMVQAGQVAKVVVPFIVVVEVVEESPSSSRELRSSSPSLLFWKVFFAK